VEMKKNNILWSEYSWNVFTGCTHCSPGCDHCFAERMSKRLQKIPLTAEKYRNGFEFTYHPMESFNPYHWKKPCKIFVNSMSDTFHEKSDVRSIRNIFKTMNECPQHTFQLLTKRPQNIPNDLYWTDNIHLGVTVCVKSELTKIDHIRNFPVKKFISFEPLLENVGVLDLKGINLVIVGGESGPGARPMHPDWVRSIRGQCKEAGIPFMFKQWGEWCPNNQFDVSNVKNGSLTPNKVLHANNNGTFSKIGIGEDPSNILMYRVGKKIAGRTLDGVTHGGGIK